MSVVRCRVLEKVIGWAAIGEVSLGGVAAAESTLQIADVAEVAVAVGRAARHLVDSSFSLDHAMDISFREHILIGRTSCIEPYPLS